MFKFPVYDTFFLDYRMLVPMGNLPNFEDIEFKSVAEPYDFIGRLRITKKGERTYHIYLVNKDTKKYQLCARYFESTETFDREFPLYFQRFTDGANYYVLINMVSHVFIWVVSKFSLCKYRVFVKYGLWFEIDA